MVLLHAVPLCKFSDVDRHVSYNDTKYNGKDTQTSSCHARLCNDTLEVKLAPRSSKGHARVSQQFVHYICKFGSSLLKSHEI